VLDSNERAIRFYERHGWTRAGNATFAIGTQDFSFLVMQIEVIDRTL
jgi:ribosomal protein S18 acetylase RimI-like enzyme